MSELKENVEFAPLPGAKISTKKRNIIISFFVILLFGIIYVLLAASVRMNVEPIPDKLSLSGFPPSIKIGENYLALPGKYHAVAHKKGYYKLREPITVKMGSDETYEYQMRKLPGLLDVNINPAVVAQVFVDGKNVGQTPIKSLKIDAGNRELSFSASRYVTLTQNILIEGMGNKQSVNVTLQPDWGTLIVESNPQGAEVWLNEVMAGSTPLTAEPVGGEYQMELRKEGYKSLFEQVVIEPGKTTTLPAFNLQKVDGVLELTSEPTDARVSINGEFKGNTPISLKVMSQKEHTLSVSKNGYMTSTQSVRVEEDKVKDLNVKLDPEYGIVFVMSTPADAQLIVDGEIIDGPASRRLKLTTLPHDIEITKKGYQSYTTTLTPTVGLSKKIDAKLLTEREARQGVKQPLIKTSEGQVMRRIYIDDPVQFQMGASRRESGRRSNETQYDVELTKTFDISVKEVTNKEFKAFLKGHDSGREEGFDLNEYDQPAAMLKWDDAARYLNWLSQKDNLPAAYEEKDGMMMAVSPMTTGYRLPTEAEWAFVARYEGDTSAESGLKKYPWGKDRKPSGKAGNYADMSASLILPAVIKGYTDGYEVASPVGEFDPNSLGIYDLGGNVSEWCHNIYDVNLSGQTGVRQDPMGAKTGEYHVIRGASWRHGSITELRLTYRDYSDRARNDVGFRFVRYVE